MFNVAGSQTAKSFWSGLLRLRKFHRQLGRYEEKHLEFRQSVLSIRAARLPRRLSSRFSRNAIICLIYR